MRFAATWWLVLCACGRVGFAELDDPDGGGVGDASEDVHGGAVAIFTVDHLHGYEWSTASITSDVDLITFQWQSTAYSGGGHGTVYGDIFLGDTSVEVRSRIELIPDNDLTQVDASDCSALAYNVTYTRIYDGQIACVRRVPQGDHAAVMLISHTDGPGNSYALTATLGVKVL